MRVYLVRHGETEYNKTGLVQGHSEVPLNQTGIEQVTRLARRLAAEGLLEHIYASDVRRAALSATIVASHTGLPITYNPLFRERDPGDLANKTIEEAVRFFEDMDYEPPNGESVPAFIDRVRRSVEHLLKCEGENGRHIALVTHGMYCRAFLNVCLGRDLEEIAGWPNASLTILDYDGRGTWDLVSPPDASHLDTEDPTAHSTGA